LQPLFERGRAVPELSMPAKALVIVCLTLAFFGSAGCVTYAAWRYPCVSREPGFRGEVMRGADGKFLYYNGECWTAKALPARDTPFL
jgi:hypothetical protein